MPGSYNIISLRHRAKHQESRSGNPMNSIHMYSICQLGMGATRSVQLSTRGEKQPRRLASLALVVVWLSTAIAAAQETAATPLQDELSLLMSRQCAAWNQGDLDEFMEYYWKSEGLTFSSGGQTTRGWQATMDRYHRTYRAAKQMGKLAFSELEVTPLGDSAALMLGRWQLTEIDKPAGGNFSLVWRKIDGQWRIIHDHTSQKEGDRP